jgi:DNA-binding HxlR family transcriptional regulator
VEYQLTELGCSLLGPVRALADWAIANREEIMAARRRFDEAGDDDLEADRKRRDAA